MKSNRLNACTGHSSPVRFWLTLCMGLVVSGILGVTDRCRADSLRVAVFQIDASPPIGSPLAYDPCIELTDPLSCRGLVLLGPDKPIVICAVDWLGVANESHVVFRQKLASAVGTDPDHVALHAVHQHDAPRCDFSAAALLAYHGVPGEFYDVPWLRDVMQRAAEAAAMAVDEATPIDAIGLGSAEVEQVASNRRILGDDGKVAFTRYTATRSAKIRAMPVGTIDPLLRMISFYHGDDAVAALTFYATHPQSYYRTGKANPDFPGYARNARQAETGVPHIHLNGAGGNVGAGKWNDGSHENRPVLASRVEDAMRRAQESTRRQPIDINDVGWQAIALQLPVGEHLVESELVNDLQLHASSAADGESSTENASQAKPTYPALTAAKHLAWLRRSEAGVPVVAQCLRLGDARVLFLPGELFVEYQLAAAKMRPDLFVATAAYGEYGPGYIGTAEAYEQGGYETSQGASRVAPDVDAVLMDAIRKLLAET